MTLSKRGDHLFAAGLSKTMRDVGDLIHTGIGETSEGRVLRTPADLLRMPSVMFNGPMLSPDWTFRLPEAGELGTVAVRPRRQVATPDSAVEAAVRGVGVTQLLSCHVAGALASGRLRAVLTRHACEPVPVHLLVHVSRNLMPLKLRRFIDFVAPRLRAALARLDAPALPGEPAGRG